MRLNSVFVAILAIMAFAAPALAQPEHRLDGDRLTVRGADLAAVSSPGSGQPDLVVGLPLVWTGTTLAYGPEVVWRLPPGDWTVSAHVGDPGGTYATTTWSITVEPPHEPTRPERIRSLVTRFFAAAAEMRAAADALTEMEVTDAEVFAAFRAAQ